MVEPRIQTPIDDLCKRLREEQEAVEHCLRWPWIMRLLCGGETAVSEARGMQKAYERVLGHVESNRWKFIAKKKESIDAETGG